MSEIVHSFLRPRPITFILNSTCSVCASVTAYRHVYVYIQLHCMCIGIGSEYSLSTYMYIVHIILMVDHGTPASDKPQWYFECM